MRNKIKYILLLSISLGIFISCEDPDAIRLPEFKDAVNVRVVIDPDYTFLDFSDLGNAKFVFDAYTENTDLQSAVFYMSYYNLSTDSTYSEVKIDFTEFPKQHYEYTAAELAEIFSLPGGIDDLGGGDSFSFRTEAITVDGRIYPDTVLQGLPQESLNVGPDITQAPATSSFTSNFVVFVSCPFIVSDAVGTYEVVVDGWADWDPGEQIEVVANPDGTGIVVLGMYSKFRNDDRGPYDVEILVNANSGIATVEQQPAWEWFWYSGDEQYGTGSVAGDGFVFSCAGIITVTLEHTVEAGTFGNYDLTLQKL
jgi:hypothetical protein